MGWFTKSDDDKSDYDKGYEAQQEGRGAYIWHSEEFTRGNDAAYHEEKRIEHEEEVKERVRERFRD